MDHITSWDRYPYKKKRSGHKHTERKWSWRPGEKTTNPAHASISDSQQLSRGSLQSVLLCAVLATNTIETQLNPNPFQWYHFLLAFYRQWFFSFNFADFVSREILVARAWSPRLRWPWCWGAQERLPQKMGRLRLCSLDDGNPGSPCVSMATWPLCFCFQVLPFLPGWVLPFRGSAGGKQWLFSSVFQNKTLLAYLSYQRLGKLL